MNIKELINRTRDNINKLKFDLPKNTEKGAMIVETRHIPDFQYIVKNHLHYLGKGWGLTVLHGLDNEDYVKEQLKGIKNINFLNIHISELSAINYNYILTSSSIWKTIPYEKILVFQTDSLLLRRGIDKFMQYDYVGAPWIHIPIKGGNGGLSLRTRSKMIEITKKFQYSHIEHGNEDLFFSKFLLEIGAKLAENKEAKKFSVETIYYDEPIGIHAAEKYLDKEMIENIILKSQLFHESSNINISI